MTDVAAHTWHPEAHPPAPGAQERGAAEGQAATTNLPPQVRAA